MASEPGTLVGDALEFAEERHAGQRRSSGAPFSNHLKEVARLLQGVGASDPMIAAGLLHDVLEDTDTTRAELEQRFGPEVAALVASVSDDPAIAGEAARKAALRRQVAAIGGDAAVVYAADKVSRARELRARRPDGNFDDGDQLRLQHYGESLAILADLLGDHPLVADLRSEMDALCALV